MLLDAHLTRLTRHINMSVAAGFNVEEYRRVKIFRQSVQHHPQIAKTLESYDKDHPNPLHNTFAAITQHVKTQLPPILSAAGATKTGRAFMAVATKTTNVDEGPQLNHADLVVAFAALTDKHKKLVDGKKRERSSQAKPQPRKQAPERFGSKRFGEERGEDDCDHMRFLLLRTRQAELAYLCTMQGYVE
jgi:hypothetical protein